MSTRDWRALKPWLKQLQPLKLQWIIGLLLALVTALFGVGLLSLSGWFITAAALYSAFDIYTPGAGIRFFAIGRTLSRYVERLINHDVVLKLQARWRVALYRRLQASTFAGLKLMRVADGVQHLTRNLDAMDNLLLRLLAPAVTFLLASVAVFTFWLFYIPAAALALLIVAVLVLVFGLSMAKRTRRIAIQQLQATQRLRRRAMATTEGITELLAWDVYRDNQQALLSQAQRQEQLDDQQLVAQHRTLWWVDLLTHGLFFIVVIICGVAYETHDVSRAELVMLVLSALAWQELAADIPSQWGGYGKTVAAAERLLAEGKPVATSATASHQSSCAEDTQLVLKQLSVARHQRQLFQPISVTFEIGTVNWLSGPSGLGKSSLAQVIMGWLKPFSGCVCLTDGGDVSANTSYLTQQTEVLDGTVRENLNPSHSNKDDDELWRVLAIVELDQVIKKLPAGLEQVIGSSGIMLSGGQLRRLVLARVLLQGRTIMLLDEPFAGLEHELAQRILKRMVLTFPNKIWLIISHIGPEALAVSELPGGQVVRLTAN